MPLMFKLFLMLFTIFFLVACVSVPTGPSVLTLPGKGISFDQFRYDESQCKQYAYEQVGGKSPKQSAMSSGVESAAIGSALGAIAGVAIGGGRGAAVGAGTGLLAGGLTGSGSARESSYNSQQRYDNSYIQCMYAKGHHVPLAGQISGNSGSNPSARYSSPPRPSNLPYTPY